MKAHFSNITSAPNELPKCSVILVFDSYEESETFFSNFEIQRQAKKEAIRSMVEYLTK